VSYPRDPQTCCYGWFYIEPRGIFAVPDPNVAKGYVAIDWKDLERAVRIRRREKNRKPKKRAAPRSKGAG
jgi:hypothetical protein